MRHSPLLTLLLATGALASGMPGQPGAEATGPHARGVAEPLRVAIIGASVSAGFVDGPLTGGSPDNRTVPLLKVARGWLAEVDAEISSRADAAMFLDPETKGTQQVERVLRKPTDLVFAVDFLFWYGYGYVSSREADEQAARLERLEKGLALLDRLAGTVILGDLPDMRGAARRMISARQIPAEDILDALNARIAAWAEERPRMHLFPLQSMVTHMKDDGIELPLSGGPFETPPGSLLQGDRLHANRLGMAWLGYQLQGVARLALPQERAAALPPTWSIDAFVDLTGAREELDELRSAQPAPGDRAAVPGSRR